MSKKMVAIDLDPGNLAWLQAQTGVVGSQDLSEVLNQVIAQARHAGKAREIQTVAGMARISGDDPELAGADEAIRALFEASHRRFEAN
jgi:hypothetical protein